MTRPTDAQAFLSSLEPLDCIICRETFDSSHPPVMLECRHIFGEKCLKEWVEHGNNTCPTCRRSLFGEKAVVSSTQEVQQPPVEALAGVMSVMPQNSGSSRRVAQLMNWLVSRSERLVATLRQLPGQAGVILDLLRLNRAAQRFGVTRPRNRLQRNPQLHPQVREDRRIAEALQARSDRDNARQITYQPTIRNGSVGRNRAQAQRDHNRTADLSGRQNPTPCRTCHGHRGDQEQTYSNRPQPYRSPSPPGTMYYGYDYTYEVDDPFDVALEPEHVIRDGEYGAWESPFDAYRYERFRSAALNGLYDPYYDLYQDR